ncbi:MAG: acyl-CoA thioesterase [Synergistaceae bacterium]|nr:acyl-CoA thioesterase [Synergistaceae bacterium]
MMTDEANKGQFIQVSSIRVRYSETDKMGIVYNSNYFVWFEIARTEYCRHFGKSYRGWEAKGYFLPVVESYCNFKYPAGYDDTVALHCRAPVDQIKPHSILFEYRLCLDTGSVIADGWTKHAFVNSEGKIYRKGNEFYDWLLREAGRLNSC